jgi:hypothetical protein
MPQGEVSEAAYNSNMRMKTHPITAVLTSAYLSAMLTSSLAPIRNNTIFAAAVDPTAAEKALQNAVSGLDAAGWAAAVAATPSPNQSAPAPVPVKVTPKTDPVMTEELMARLLKYARALEPKSSLSPAFCKALNLCDGTKVLPVKLAESEVATEGKHFIGLTAEPDSKDVLIVVDRPTHAEVYLTDKTGRLRAAAISENNAVRLITNEQAEKKFKAELSIFAVEAATLPPTGAAVAGNS